MLFAPLRAQKVGLVLYQHAATRSPSTYWLGLVGLTGNDRIVIRGTWTIRKGARDFPEAVVYELDAGAPKDLQRHWRVSEDVLLPLDQSMRPLAGNAAWGSAATTLPTDRGHIRFGDRARAWWPVACDVG